MCYVLAPAGRALIAAARPENIADRPRATKGLPNGFAERTGNSSRGGDLRRLRQARHDVHVAGWAIALMRCAGNAGADLRGADEAVLEPPGRATPSGRAALSPAELRLPGGRVPHDFTRTIGAGAPIELDRVETIRPDAVIELPGAAIDVLVELDDRLPRGTGAAKLERYDHFLAGWSAHTRRYGERRQAAPFVVFVCRDRTRARRCAELADAALRACRAYAGEYPFDWEYPGREGTLFVAERDIHEGVRCAYGVPRLPPAVRVVEAHGDPLAAETVVEVREIPG